MESETLGHVTVSRRIPAPASAIFAVLLDPHNHCALDGSGMLRAALDSELIAAVGDEFSMQMHLDSLGDYVIINRVLEFEPDRRLTWEPTPGDGAAAANAELEIGESQGYWWGFDLEPEGPDATVVTEIFDCTANSEGFKAEIDYGNDWLGAMEETLERLATLLRSANH